VSSEADKQRIQRAPAAVTFAYNLKLRNTEYTGSLFESAQTINDFSEIGTLLFMIVYKTKNHPFGWFLWKYTRETFLAKEPQKQTCAQDKSRSVSLCCERMFV
jgi:hypothetical protein